MLKKKQLLLCLVVAGLGVGVAAWLLERGVDHFVYQGKSVEAWAVQLDSPQPELRDQATVALKALGPAAIPRLSKMLRTRDSLIAKKLWPLTRKLPPRPRAWTGRYVRPPRALIVRAAAAHALGVLGASARPALPDLAKALNDPGKQVSWYAANALAHFGKDSVGVLMAALRHRDPFVRNVVVFALGEIGPDAQAAVPDLVCALADADPAVRGSAVNSLGAIGPSALPEVVKAVGTGSGETRRAAARVLVQLCPSGRIAAGPLLKMLEDLDPLSRQQAIEGLGLIHVAGEPAIAAIANRLKDPDPGVRLAAARVLGELNRQSQLAVPALTQALNDAYPAVREQAAKTLSQIGTAAKTGAKE